MCLDPKTNLLRVPYYYFLIYCKGRFLRVQVVVKSSRLAVVGIKGYSLLRLQLYGDNQTGKVLSSSEPSS